MAAGNLASLLEPHLHSLEIYVFLSRPRRCSPPWILRSSATTTRPSSWHSHASTPSAENPTPWPAVAGLTKRGAY
ncbi:hypothetical protein GUJ93_ZPchr0001g31612 [Zizania palustris]|uniref:Uncharacterized protein n=1 Tax=Zizania palustris TaxID=103762 RepID=A0A8J5RR39_ZIZPA|nr:hypothetical protein GUJ93_ZPchr0001g31612 [Zizania palustris]